MGGSATQTILATSCGRLPYLFYNYYSAHPCKGRVVLVQLPLVMWASGCWQYERTLYSRRPFSKGPEFLSIYLGGSVLEA